MLNAPVIKLFLPGASAADGFTDAWTLSGTAIPNSSVNVFDGNSLIGHAQTDATGSWSFVSHVPVSGALTFTAKAAVSSGNTSATSAPFFADTLSSVKIASGASIEIDGPSAQSITFSGKTGTLKLGDSVAFTGEIAGLAGSDALDLADVSYGAKTRATFSGNSAGGTLTVTDGTNTANIALEGKYLASGWTLSSDGNGGTVVVDPAPAATWKPLDIGAGGYLTGIDIAPDGTMVVRTDTYGAYIWNGTEWQQLVTSTSMPAAFVATGNAQGVYEIEIAPSDSSILYMMYEGYVFRSDNKGATWTQTSFSRVTENPNDPYRMNGQKMAVDPNNSNVVYVGTPQNGLFVTTDGGATWQSVTGLPVSLKDTNGAYPGITGLEFVPSSGVSDGKTNTIFASSYGNGVYESTNGGASWSQLSGGPSDVEYAAVSSTGIYYAVGDNNTSLWHYTNGAWTELLSNANVGGNGIHTVAVDPFNPDHIVVSTPSGNLDQSLDGGATWSGIDWNNTLSATDVPWLAGTGQYMSIGGTAFDPLVPGKLWTSSGVGVWNTTLPQSFKTHITWNSQSSGIEQLVANEIIVPPGGNPVVASWDRSFFSVADPNTPATTYGVSGQKAFAAGWSIDYASSNPTFLVGIADWWGVEESGYSTDGGQNWQVFPTEPPFAGQTIGGTIAASSATDIVWAPADGIAPYYTLNGGVTWNPVVLPGVSNWSNFDYAYYLDKRTVTADRVLPNTFYMYYVGSTNASDGVYKSTDGGATWTEVFSGQISANSGGNSKIESVPGEAGNLFFTGGHQSGPQPSSEGFYQSTNGGATWTAVPNVTEVSCFGFGASATPGGYPSIYIVGYVSGVYGVWQSNDDAQSWAQIGPWPEGSLDTITTITGDPNIYGQVYVGFAGSGYAYLPASPGVTGVIPSIPNGDLNAGKTITLTLNLSTALTVSGGIPTLTLNDGGIATYSGGSGTKALSFSYTVLAGRNTPDLAVTAVNLNSATVTDLLGNTANLSGAVTNPAGTLQIDTTTPTVNSVTDNPTSGLLNTGKLVTLTVHLSEAVTVAGGIPTLSLNDGGTASYTSGSGTNTLNFSYTVVAGQSTPDLAVTAVNLNSATVTNGAGNAADLSAAVTNPVGTLTIDATTPTVMSVIATAPNEDLSTGEVVTIAVHLSEAVTVTSSIPRLVLNDGAAAIYTSGTGTNTLTFSYTVAAGQNTPDLTVTAINLNGAMVKDMVGANAADLSAAVTNLALQVDTKAPTVTSVAANPATGDLNGGKVVTLTIHLSEVVMVAGVPTLTLNDGGTATYATGTGTNALNFNYTVAAGQNTADLAVTAVNLGSATVKDGAGNAANLSGAVSNPAGTLQIDTTAPTVTKVVAYPLTGVENTGARINLTLDMSKTVTVTGAPTLALNDGGVATYSGGTGTNVLTFSYTVEAGDSTVSALAITGVNLPNGAAIKDGAGNAAILSGAATTLSGLQIVHLSDTIASGATLELASAFSGTVLFAGPTGTMKIDNASSFSGKIAGQLAIGDVIDLKNITAGAKAKITYSGNDSPGVLTVSDGTHTASIALLGNYSLGNFTASSDGNGGTSIVDPPLPGQNGNTSLEVFSRDPADSQGALNQQMALWVQHMASAFPTSAAGSGGTSMVGQPDWGGGVTPLAQSGGDTRHA